MRNRALIFIDQQTADREGYLGLDEDVGATGVADACYCVGTPDKDNPLKTYYTYYTGRRRSTYTVGGGKGQEWVYVLAHPLHQDLYKVGFTAGDPYRRLKEINRGTGGVGEYTMIYLHHTHDGKALEEAIHRKLSDVRIHPRKGHFQVDRQTIVNVIKGMAEIYG